MVYVPIPIHQIDDKEVYGTQSRFAHDLDRDHTHQMKGFGCFEEDMVSAVIFLDNQMPDGIYDFVAGRLVPG